MTQPRDGESADLPILSDAEFALLQALIRQTSGIHLGPVKRALVVGRLARRLRALGLRSFLQYYRRVVDDPIERGTMLDCISTNETHFFREPLHFEFLERTVFPIWRAARARTIRVWSAGCSTGEEPYSLAMLLAESFPCEAGWDIEIVATDLSSRVLRAAEEGVFSFEKAKEIPGHLLRSYMLRGVRSQEGRIKAAPALRARVRFSQLNLNDERYDLAGSFQLILCRNVLIYFDDEIKSRVVERLIGHLAPEGYLLVGHAESLSSLGQNLVCLRPTIYRAVSGVSPARGAAAASRTREFQR